MCREDRVLLSCGERSVDIYSFLLEPRKGRCVHLNCLRVLDEVEEESSTTEEGIFNCADSKIIREAAVKAVRELVLWSTSYSVSSDEIRDFHCAALKLRL
ncbi:hypothetical protein YC2023_095989 [Brassica napus]